MQSLLVKSWEGKLAAQENIVQAGSLHFSWFFSKVKDLSVSPAKESQPKVLSSASSLRVNQVCPGAQGSFGEQPNLLFKLFLMLSPSSSSVPETNVETTEPEPPLHHRLSDHLIVYSQRKKTMARKRWPMLIFTPHHVA